MGGQCPLFLYMKLKYHKEGDPIPADFWNYDLNIILGYRYREKESWKKQIKRYGITPKGEIK